MAAAWGEFLKSISFTLGLKALAAFWQIRCATSPRAFIHRHLRATTPGGSTLRRGAPRGRSKANDQGLRQDPRTELQQEAKP